jgi:hypothetical protein
MTFLNRRHPILASFLAASLVTALVVPPAVAEPYGARHKREESRVWGKPSDRSHGSHRGAVRGKVVVVDSRDRHRRHDWGHRDYRRPVVRGKVIYVPKKRVRHYRNVVIVRPYGRWYYGYGHYHRDTEAWRFLAFTAITLAILNNLNERQQRTYESAQIRAVTAPVGQTIAWNDGGASGTVTTLRDGTSSTGQYCREFQQTVTIGGRNEEAYGTACRKPDGAWEVVSSGQ